MPPIKGVLLSKTRGLVTIGTTVSDMLTEKQNGRRLCYGISQKNCQVFELCLQIDSLLSYKPIGGISSGLLIQF